MPRLLPVLLAAALLPAVAPAQDKKEPKKKGPTYTRTEDVIYGRKYGLAMTLDVFAPKDREKANGAGIIFCVSGGWFSAKQATPVGFIAPLVDRGYTVFAVVHGSQPKFTIPEVLEDMHRAVRFVRHNAKKYGVDPDRLGITGGSAGGHLSLMQGTTGKAGGAKSLDPVDRESSKVQAVACFFPPTDFLNYGKKGNVNLGTGTLAGFRPPFEFWERDPLTNALIVIPYEAKRREIGKEISPVYHVSKDSAPALIMHGDADKLVPIQQAELMIAAYEKAGVPCKLVTKEGGDHGWKGMDQDLQTFADWFDKHLAKK
jgi:acetyl esterase/lipase